jgi:hypothetical protein
MELILWVIRSRSSTTAVGARDTFAEEVGLHHTTRCAKVIAGPLPIYLIQIIRHHDCTCDYSDTGGGLQNHLDAAKEHIELSPDIWGIHAFGEGEIGSVRSAVCDGSSIGKNPI